MDFSYSISAQLKESLNKIEYLRIKIYFKPLTIKEELRMRWENQLQRLYFAFSFPEVNFRKNEIVKILSGQGKNSSREQELIRYKEALDQIYWEHLGANKIVSAKAVLDIYGRIKGGSAGADEKKIRNLLDYLSASPDHPVVQAGVVHEEILFLSPFSSRNDQMSFLLNLLFLYRSGYDFRGLLVLEEYLRKNLAEYNRILANTYRTRNLTLWLEYFASAIISQLDELLKDMENLDYKTGLPSSFFELNERQKHILSLLEEPGSRITNKKVQSIFNISQITASRDLARLKALNLVISRGKGRSVYYTRG